MYNRYVPQPDGSYRRNRIPEIHRPPEKPPVNTPHPSDPPPQTPCPEQEHFPVPPRQEERISSFLRNLLPKDLDTGDLLIILLLLLMAGDREEERNNALLTLALYLFL